MRMGMITPRGQGRSDRMLPCVSAVFEKFRSSDARAVLVCGQISDHGHGRSLSKRERHAWSEMTSGSMRSGLVNGTKAGYLERHSTGAELSVGSRS